MRRHFRRTPRTSSTRFRDPESVVLADLSDHLLRDIGYVRTAKLRWGTLVRPYGP